MVEVVVDDLGELGNSEQDLPAGGSVNQPVIDDEVPIVPQDTSHEQQDIQTGPETSTSPTVDKGGELNDHDLLEDAKLYQAATIEYQEAYNSLQDKYFQQAHLMEQATAALKVVEDRPAQLAQTLSVVKENCEAEVQQALNKVVSQYQGQLTKAQSSIHEQKAAITKLWEQVRNLELSLASHADVPSVGQTQESVDLQKEVFNILPGTVNTKQGAVTYESSDQPLSFQKHVWFGDRSTVPDLKMDSAESDDSNMSIASPNYLKYHHQHQHRIWKRSSCLFV